MSFWFIRRLNYGVFIKGHTLLSIVTLGALVWHTLLLDTLFPRVLAFIAPGFWITTTAFRLSRALYYGAAAVEIRADEQVIRALVHPRRPVRVYPGCYFYLYFPAAPFRLKVKGHPMSVTWWVDEQHSSYSAGLVFLLFRYGSISSLAKSDGVFRKVLLDGPYGRDLRLYDYENVILTGKGQGIAGILPHALHLAERRLYDKQTSKQTSSRRPPYLDKTRKVDLFWILEDNSQQKWLRDELRALQKLDPHNVSSLPATHLLTNQS